MIDKEGSGRSEAMFVIKHLNCRRVRHLLWDHLTQRLSEGPLEMVERHLEDCPRCRREAAGLKRAQALLAACRREPVPSPSTRWQTLRICLEEGPLPMAPRRPAWQIGLGAAGGVAALLLAISVTVRLSVPGSLSAVSGITQGKTAVQSGIWPPKSGTAPSRTIVHNPSATTTQRSNPIADPGATLSFVKLNDLWYPGIVSATVDRPSSEPRAHVVRAEVKAATPNPLKQVQPAPPGAALVQDESVHSLFRHYNARPEDRLTEHSSVRSADDSDLHQVGNDGGYVIEPLRPDDNETPY